MAVEFRAERYEESISSWLLLSRGLWTVWGRGCSVQSSEEGQKRGGVSLCLQLLNPLLFRGVKTGTDATLSVLPMKWRVDML